MSTAKHAEAMDRLGWALINSAPLEPGIHYNIPMREYLALEYMSASALWQIQRSPAHARAYTEQFYEIGNDDSIATIVGTAAHTAVLEPEKFERRYLRGPDGNWTNKAPKDEVAALRLANPGCVVLKPNKYDAVLAARAAIMSDPTARPLLDEATDVEVTIIWDDPETGIRCKARPDFLVPEWATIADLKSAENAGSHAFAKAIAKFGYHRKAAFYLEGMNAVGLDRYSEFAFVAFEKERPYAVAVYQLFPHDLERATQANHSLLRRWALCIEANEWPAYPSDVTYIDLPKWVDNELEI